MLKPRYENLEELLKEVRTTRGLDTSIEFIVHVQDLIGHCCIEDLDRLSHEYKQTFYWVYDEAEGIEETIKFFAEHSNFATKLQEDLSEAEADRDKYQFLLKEEEKKSLQYAKERNEAEAKANKTEKALADLEAKNKVLEDELITLKAKLYDLMTA